MTFEEAFNSGCRFKLPPGHLSDDPGAWPDGWWLIKKGNKINVLGLPKTFTIKEFFYEMMSLVPEQSYAEYQRYKKSDAWYLHPQDEHNMKFSQKLEDIVNADV